MKAGAFPRRELREHNEECNDLTPGKDRSVNQKPPTHGITERRWGLEIFGTPNHFWMWVKWWDMKHFYVIWEISRWKTKNRVCEILTKILVNTLCCSFSFSVCNKAHLVFLAFLNVTLSHWWPHSCSFLFNFLCMSYNQDNCPSSVFTHVTTLPRLPSSTAFYK